MQLAAGHLGLAIAVVDLARHSHCAGSHRLGRDVALGDHAVAGELVVAGVGAAQGQLDIHVLGQAGVLVDELCAQIEAQLFAVHAARQLAAADLGAGRAVINLARHLHVGHRHALGRNAGLGRTVKAVVAGIGTRQVQAGDADRLVLAHILVGKAGGAAAGLNLVAGHQALQVHRAQFCAQLAVIDLVLDRTRRRANALGRDLADGATGAVALQGIAVHRHRAIAGLAQNDAVDADLLALAHILVGIARLAAHGVDHLVAVYGAGLCKVACAERGIGLAVVDLARRALQAHADLGRHGVEEAISSSQHGAAGVGLVLLELVGQTATLIGRWCGRVDMPVARRGLQRLRTRLVAEVAAGGQQQRCSRRVRVIGLDGLLEHDVRGRALGAHIHRARGVNAVQAVGAAHGQAAPRLELQAAHLSGDLVHLMRAAVQGDIATIAPQRQLGGADLPTARDARANLVIQRHRAAGRQRLIHLQAALLGRQEQTSGVDALGALLHQSAAGDLQAITHVHGQARQRHIVISGIDTHHLDAIEGLGALLAQRQALAAQLKRGIGTVQGELDRGFGLPADRGARCRVGRHKARPCLQLERAAGVVEGHGRVHIQLPCGIQGHGDVLAGVDAQAIVAIHRAQAPIGRTAANIGVTTDLQRQLLEVEAAVAQHRAAAGSHGQILRSHTAVTADDLLAAQQMDAGGGSADVAVEHQIATIFPAHGQGGGVHMPDGGVVQASAKMQIVRGRHLADGDLARAILGINRLADVDGVAGEGDVPHGVDQLAGGDFHRLVDHFEMAGGLAIEVARHADGAGAVFAADGQVLDAGQLVQRGLGGKTVGVTQDHIGAGCCWL